MSIQPHIELTESERMAADIDAGDVVRLKSGGRLMSVALRNASDALCFWDTPDGPKAQSIPVFCLERADGNDGASRQGGER